MGSRRSFKRDNFRKDHRILPGQPQAAHGKESLDQPKMTTTPISDGSLGPTIIGRRSRQYRRDLVVWAPGAAAKVQALPVRG